MKEQADPQQQQQEPPTLKMGQLLKTVSKT
jgi:hypothetical protein